MKRLISIFAALSLAVFGLSASATDGFTYTGLGTPALAPGGLTVTLNSLQIVEKSGSTQLVINYSQKNNTADKKLNEGQFKLFFTDGTSEPQYGFFNSFFPGDGNTRSYTWEWLKGKEPWLIEWEPGFFTAEPTATGLKWKVGSNFPVPTATSTPTPTATPSTSTGTATQSGLMYELKATNYSPTTGQWANTSGVNASFITRSVVSGATFPAKGMSPDSVEFNGSTNGFQFITSEKLSNPQSFSLDVWFRTTGAGKIFGFESSTNMTGNVSYDRHLYLGSNGRLYFGVWTGSIQVVNTTSNVNDGAWHHAVVTFSDDTASLYLDGDLIQTRRTGPADKVSGYWRIGGNRLNGWVNAADGFFDGSIGEARIYNRALTATEVSNSHAQTRAAYASRPTSTPTPSPTPTPTPTPAATPELGDKSATFRWVGNEMIADFVNIPSFEKIVLKVGSSWVPTKKDARNDFTIKKVVTPGPIKVWVGGEFLGDYAVPTIYKDCASVWKIFDGGISKTSSSKNKGAKASKKPTVFLSGYLGSVSLDKDKDGLACER